MPFAAARHTVYSRTFPEVQIMQRVIQQTARFVRAEDGPTAVEYAVMLALVIATCMVAVKSFGGSVDASFTRTANSIAS
jgi:pilus assembly protein Flp/PilA